MTFTSPSFFVLFAVFFPLYWLCRGHSRLLVIFAASVVYYGWWDWRFLLLIAVSITVDYSVSLLISSTESRHKRFLLLLFSLVVNLGILFFFKYFNFFLRSVTSTLAAIGIDAPDRSFHIILPIGISFYTFKSLSYTIDVYRSTIPPERSWLRYAAYIIFFPQLLAGPIVRAGRFLPQLHTLPTPNWRSFLSGMQLVVWGYFMKCVVADSLLNIVNTHFDVPQNCSSLGLLIAVILYAFQIYGDFSGYSLIAIGLGQILGFDFGKNFDRPYFSQSFSEFWQRWHISLSTWLRDYLYIPLGGNRHGALMTYRNLMLTMLLGGLWHGASANFIIWGGLHGIFLVVQRLISPTYRAALDRWRVPTWLSGGVNITCVFSLTCLTWIFFRARSMDESFYIIRKIVLFDGQGFDALQLKFEMAKGLAIVLFLIMCEVVSFRVAIRSLLDRYPLAMIPAGALTIWLISLLGTFGTNAFVYFQF